MRVAASASVLSQTIMPATVTIGGIPAGVMFAGLAPGFVGLYQINVTIPTGIQSGNNTMSLVLVDNISSTPVQLAVQ